MKRKLPPASDLKMAATGEYTEKSEGEIQEDLAPIKYIGGNNPNVTMSRKRQRRQPVEYVKKTTTTTTDAN